MDVDQTIVELGTSVISADEPCGVNAKYEPAYEQLEAELAKSESIASETTDWDEVYNACINILQNVSKDYACACYLTYALSQKYGYQGLLNGFALLEKLCETHWEHMFPPVKRLRGRQNATQWLVEKVAHYIESKEPTNDEMALVTELAGAVKNLDFYLSDKMGDKAPSFTEISRPLKRLKQIASSMAPAEPVKAPEPTTPEATTTQAPVETKTTAAEPVAEAAPVAQVQKTVTPPKSTTPSNVSVEPVGDLASESDARRAYRQIQESLRKLSEFYGQAKASDPRRFRMSRSALWDSIDKLPPNSDGKTQLPPLPADKLKKVQALFESGEYVEAIALAEKSANKMPYWFDGNRYIAMSMEALGGEYNKAKETLETELKNFVARLPKIVDFMYSNGNSFADEQSKLWIKSLASENSNGGNDGGEENLIGAALAEAKKLAIAGKLAEGFAVINECKVNSKRDRFHIKMACAELACISGQVKVGIPMLERLIEETRTLTVADWESDFMAKALALLVNAYEKLDEDDASKKEQQKAAAYDQLCWYDPAHVAG